MRSQLNLGASRQKALIRKRTPIFAMLACWRPFVAASTLGKTSQSDRILPRSQGTDGSRFFGNGLTSNRAPKANHPRRFQVRRPGPASLTVQLPRSADEVLPFSFVIIVPGIVSPPAVSLVAPEVVFSSAKVCSYSGRSPSGQSERAATHASRKLNWEHL